MLLFALVMSEGEIKQWFTSNGYGDVKKRGGMGGSGWSSTAKWASDTSEFFVKTSSKSYNSMFRGEAEGLRVMRSATSALKIPQVYHASDYENGRGSYIIMEYLKLGGRGDAFEFGKAVASMHLADVGDKFGFTCDNTIGATPQPNPLTENWVDFYRDKRLKHQVNLAGDSSIDNLASKLYDRLDDFFGDEQVRPSVIHGDLWSGNIGTASGLPTLFDPATSFSHHEAEWGMSWCASLSPSFWAGYRELIPEAPKFKMRRPLYELYHQLNHYNLFGGGYRNNAISCLDQCLRSLRDM